jgi:hypothetical protein
MKTSRHFGRMPSDASPAAIDLSNGGFLAFAKLYF